MKVERKCCMKLFISSCQVLALLAIVASACRAGNTGTIAGKVVDEKGGGLPGAIVKVLTTNRGAVTDPDGKYRIIGVPTGLPTSAPTSPTAWWWKPRATGGRRSPSTAATTGRSRSICNPPQSPSSHRPPTSPAAAATSRRLATAPRPARAPRGAISRPMTRLASRPSRISSRRPCDRRDARPATRRRRRSGWRALHR